MSESNASPEPRRRRRWLRALGWLGLLLVLLAAGLYLGRRQIGALLAQRLDTELAARGIYASWESARWLPGPGIQVDGVALYRDAVKRERLAWLSTVKVLKAEPGWDRWQVFTVETQEAQLKLDQGEKEALVEGFALRATVEPRKLLLESAQGKLWGVRVEAKGQSPLPAPGEARTAGEKGDAAAASPLAKLNLEALQTVRRVAAWVPERQDALVKIDFRPPAEGPGRLVVAVALELKSFRWQGLRWEFVIAEARAILPEDGPPAEVQLERCAVSQGGRQAELAGVLDLPGQKLRLQRFSSELDLLGLARAALGESAGLDRLSAPPAWQLSGQGEIVLTDPARSRLQGRLALAGDLVLADGTTRVVLGQPAAGFTLENGQLRLADLGAGLWGGRLEVPELQLTLPAAGVPPRLRSELRLAGASLPRALASLGSTQRHSGTLQLDWKGSGGLDALSLTGAGSVTVTGAEFFEIPLLGTLTTVFQQLTPGFGGSVATALRVRYRLANGRLQLENLVLDNQQAHIEAEGSLDLVRQYAKLNARANLRGIVGLATALVTSLLEVEGEGPWRDVRWRLKSAPGTKAIGKAAEAVGKTGGAVVKGAGEAAKGTGKAASGLLKRVGKPFGR
ncbi:MAG: hypothetical protein JSR82_02680 [Verrucomicrobia bacterium]|nr:hypothetical protein [Verrucomicrobiota bacterium]